MLEEAIKELRKQLAIKLGNFGLTTAIRVGDKKALSIQLGIEALRKLQLLREITDSRILITAVRELLPSETDNPPAKQPDKI